LMNKRSLNRSEKASGWIYRGFSRILGDLDAHEVGTDPVKNAPFRYQWAGHYDHLIHQNLMKRYQKYL
jgi:hypothetical protein